VFGLMLTATCAAWLVPLVLLSGGPGAYLHENALLADAVVSQTSVLDAGAGGLLYNLTFEGFALVIGLGLGLVTLALWALRLVSFSLSRPVRTFLLLWSLPPLLFYAVSHVGQYGYMLVVVPPLAILSAVSARVLAEIRALPFRTAHADCAGGTSRSENHEHIMSERYKRRERREIGSDGVRFSLAICGAIALFSLSYFAFADGPTTASNIANNDAHWRAVQAALRDDNPDSTILIMGIEWDGPFREAGYLLPQYRSYGIDTNRNGDLRWLYGAYQGKSDYSLPMPEGHALAQLPPNTRKVIALDPITAQRFASGGTLDCIQLSDGSTLYVVNIDNARRADDPTATLVMECSQISLSPTGQ
jgi:hypothetical protein